MKWRLIAALTLLLAVAGAAYPVVSNSIGEQGPITVTAQFDEASGLYAGNGVEILGLRVGTVTKVVPKGTYVEVTMDIEKPVKVPADVMAATISTSILTDRRVELSPPYTSGPTLKDHDVIPPNRTRTPVGFDRVLAMIDKLTTAMRGDGKGSGPLADLIAIGATASEGSGDQIKSALDELSKAMRMTTDGAVTKDNLTTIITSMSALTKAAADNDTVIRKFGAAVHATTEILAEENFGTGTTGKKINQVLAQAADLLDKNRDTIKALVHNGTVMSGAMNDKKRELAETFDVLPLMLDNFYNAVDPVNGSLHVHALLDKIQFDSQLTKELCNLMGLRQLGCSTGLPQDYGPDFGLTFMLDSMARMGQGN